MSDIQPPKPPDSENNDPLLESLLEQARPIIAEERGLNHRSRVKIQSLGKKLKIPAAVIDQALQLLHGAPPVLGSESSAGTEYEKTFAKVMARKIADIPGQILTNKIEEKAISVGTRKYQLSETQARNIVRRVAEEVGVPRVTLTDAEKHTEQEIADAIGEATWVAGEKKQRLIRNAKRLGVSESQAESMIQRHLKFNFQQVQNERKFTDRLWIFAALIVIGTSLSLFIFFQLKKAKKENDSFEEADLGKKTTPDIDEDPVNRELVSPDWWDDSLKLQLQKTRLKVGGFPEIHDRLKSRKEAIRSQAYSELFDLGKGLVNPQLVRQRVSVVIPQLILSEPSPEAMTGAMRGFEKAIKMPVGKIPSSAEFFNKAFWALDLLNQIVGDESIDDTKVVLMQSTIESITGRGFDLFLSANARLKKQKRALVEVYFKQMADLGASFPTVAAESFDRLESMAKDELPADKVQELRLLFLTGFLRTEHSNWSNASSLIQKTIIESSSSEVSFFIDLMESTSNEPLQLFLEEALLKRAGIGDDHDSVAELAVKLREYFDVGTPEKVESRKSSTELVSRIVNQYYNKWSIRNLPLDNRQSAELLVESIYLTTIVSMLESDEAESLELLLEAGFPDLENPQYLAKISGEPEDLDDDSGASGMGTGTASNDPGAADGAQRLARQRLNDALGQLNRFKILSTERRIVALRQVRGVATTLNKLDGSHASILASYLLARKNPEEQQFVLEIIPEFRRWPRLMIAIADQLSLENYPRQNCLDVCSQLLDEDLRYGDQDWSAKLVDHLRSAAMQQLRLNASLAANGKKGADPVFALKELIEYFYRLRVRSIVTNTKIPESTDLASSIDFLIDHNRRQLVSQGKSRELIELNKWDEMAPILGDDPLSELQFRQQALLAGMPRDSSVVRPGDAGIATKLVRLAESKLQKIDSIIGQIAENEIWILLNYHIQKLK